MLSPHPDDESIGCGGSLRKHVLAGDEVHVVFLTSGEQGGHGRSREDTARIREAEARAAGEILGVAVLEFWREPDGALEVGDGVVERLRTKIRHLGPELIYVTHDHEMHPDHLAAAELVRCAVSVAEEVRPCVLMYEVWTPLQQIDEVVDVSDHMEVKLTAIRAHVSQCDVMRFDEAVHGLNRYRGEMFSWPEGDYAEVFARMWA